MRISIRHFTLPSLALAAALFPVHAAAQPEVNVIRLMINAATGTRAWYPSITAEEKETIAFTSS